MRRVARREVKGEGQGRGRGRARAHARMSEERVARCEAGGDTKLTDSVDPLTLRSESIMQDIITRRRDGQDVVILVDAELLDVHVGVFPRLFH